MAPDFAGQAQLPGYDVLWDTKPPKSFKGIPGRLEHPACPQVRDVTDASWTQGRTHAGRRWENPELRVGALQLNQEGVPPDAPGGRLSMRPGSSISLTWGNSLQRNLFLGKLMIMQCFSILHRRRGDPVGGGCGSWTTCWMSSRRTVLIVACSVRRKADGLLRAHGGFWSFHN